MNIKYFYKLRTTIGLILGLIIFLIYQIIYAYPTSNIPDVLGMFFLYILFVSICLILFHFIRMDFAHRNDVAVDNYIPTAVDGFKVLIGFITGIFIWIEYFIVMSNVTSPAIIFIIGYAGIIYLFAPFPFMIITDLMDGWIG